MVRRNEARALSASGLALLLFACGEGDSETREVGTGGHGGDGLSQLGEDDWLGGNGGASSDDERTPDPIEGVVSLPSRSEDERTAYEAARQQARRDYGTGAERLCQAFASQSDCIEGREPEPDFDVDDCVEGTLDNVADDLFSERSSTDECTMQHLDALTCSADGDPCDCFRVLVTSECI